MVIQYSVFSNCRLRDYFDIAYLIKYNEIDWESIFLLSQELEITHKIYDVLRSVHQIYNFSDKFVSNIMSKFKIENCNYKMEMVYFGDTEKPLNSGLLVQEHKANARYSVFDKDFCSYEFIKNYKSVLYSKKNDWFLNRIILSEGNSSNWIKYKSYNYDILAYYNFKITDNFLLVTLKIDKTKIKEFKKHNLVAKVEWTDNDISSCLLLSGVSTSIIDVETVNISSEYGNISIYDSLYSGIEYKNSMGKVKNEFKTIEIKHYNNNDFYSIVFYFEKNYIFECIDFIAMEVKINTKFNDSIEMNIGGELNIIQSL